MSAKGRGSGRPNLALAGKRETPAAASKQKNDNAGRGRGRGRGRGGERGGGRGGRGGGQKQELIQTGGVFSEGLGGEFPTRKPREKDADMPTFTIAKRDTGAAKNKDKEETKKDDKKSEGKTSFKGWDELWASDDEKDSKELDSLMPKGLLSDYRRGTVLPLVLPHDDEKQFISVMHKSVKEEIMSDGEEEEKEKELKDEPMSPTKKAVFDEIARMSNSTLRYSRKAATALRSLPTDSRRPDFVLVQLPSVVGALCRENVQREQNDESMEVDEEMQQSTSDDSVLPKGRTIGKLQVTKNGRVLLRIGDFSMDVCKTIPGGQKQGVVLLETTQKEEDPSSPSLFASSESVNQKNALYQLGEIKHHMMASMVWSALEEKLHLRDDKEDGDEKMDADSSEKTEDAELEELLKEQNSWSQMAERWAGGH